MKKLLVFLSFSLAAITSINAQVPEKKASAETLKQTYACPMHPDQTSESPGNCPKCGMELVKITEKKFLNPPKGSQARMEMTTKYLCKDDGTVSDQAGKCSKCGKELTKVETPKTAYCCRMHPNQTSPFEGKCSICGMPLVKMTKKEYIHSTKGSKARMEKRTKYICAEDGSTSDSPGACNKCGKERTKIEAEVLHEHQ